MFPFELKEMMAKAFRQSGTNTKVAVTIDQTTPIPVDTEGIEWDSFTVSYPSPTTEVYTFSLNSVVVEIITLNYQSASKKVLLSGTKVNP